MKTLLIADDHPLFREAIKNALNDEYCSLHILESDSLASTLKMLDEHRVNMLFLDLYMPDSSDLYGFLRIKQLFPDLPIVIVSATEDLGLIAKLIALGAKGFVPKTSTLSEVLQAIEAILGGQVWLPKEVEQKTRELEDEFTALADKIARLTPAQYRVFCGIGNGLLNKQIGHELNIAEATVKAHVTAVFKKLGINNRTQAAMLASQLDLDVSDLKH
ncbi:response regulator transcription factor [Agaribacter flavus]|uniref:Response regulator n=1 Tax=Agaribacter flavus TaxID=1902781 RepID=A0ABV7FLQ2_9ALTE